MKGLVIILLGVSGVGKSRLANKIAELRPELLVLSAGALLRKYLKVNSEALRTAGKKEVQKNQFILADALESERKGQEQRIVLLEAHSFIDNDRELVDVPVQIMRSLAPAGFILMNATGEQLAQQRGGDSRVRPKRTVAELKRHLVHSEEMAELYSVELKVPLIKINRDDYQSAMIFIDEIDVSVHRDK